MKNLILFLLMTLLLTACSSAVKLRAGDAVLVDWARDAYAWHNAKLVEPCDDGKGWVIDFKDDFYDAEEGTEPKCYVMGEIVVDRVPENKEVKKGEKVYAEWGGSYYGATVQDVKDGKYSIKYDDNYDDEVELPRLRVQTKMK